MKFLVLVLALTYSLASLAVEFYVGDRIVDQYGNTGTIECLFSNNTAEITLDNYPDTSYVRKLSTLGKGVCCIETVCTDHKISDEYGNVGSIKELFHNGMAKIMLRGHDGYFTRNLTTLGISLGCIENKSCHYTFKTKE